MHDKKAARKRTLAIDYGLARIGIAISDQSKTIASPLPNLQGSKNIEEAVARVISFIENIKQEKNFDIDEIVIGLPKTLSGQDSERTTIVRQFSEMLAQKVPYPVHLFDERLTTVQAERTLKEFGFSRKERSKHVDKVSAIILLQTYLEQKAFQNMNRTPLSDEPRT
jgi:putative holliday junction resolvase